jgi:hypothetical protein
MKASASRPKARRQYRKSGVFGLQRALKRRGLKALDGRSSLARNVAAWRTEVTQDLGGDLSRAERTVLDMAAAGVALLHIIDAWVGAHPEQLVNGRKRSVAPVVRERIAVAAHVKDLLVTLGIKRRPKPAPTLAEYFAQKEREKATAPTSSEAPIVAQAGSQEAES